MNKNARIIFYSAAILLVFFLFFYGLAKGKGFFAPLFTAIILSLVMLPLSQKMEKHMKRYVAALLNTLILFLLSLGFVALVSIQIKGFVNDWPKIKEKMEPKIERLKTFVVSNSPLDEKDLQPGNSGQSSSSSGSSSTEKATGMLSKVTSFLGNYLLTFVYIFFLLNYRRRFKVFVLRLFPEEKKESVKNVLEKSASVAPHYLRGRLILIGMLAVLYSIGLGITGVNNFIIVSILAALLSLIPYVGNIIGFFIAVAFGFLSSGDPMVLVGISITFIVAQFVESYILEPYLLGDEVDVHPFFVILVVVIGNMVWGVIGMILAIPLMGILTVILLHIPQLRPYGLLFSKKKMPER